MVGHSLGHILELIAFVVFAAACWKRRRFAANSDAFAVMVAFTLVVTIAVFPTFALYNEVFLLPGILVLAKERRTIWRRSAADRFLFVLAAISLFWPWLATTSLSALSFILPQLAVERAWAVPFWSAPFLPVVVAASLLITGYRQFFTAPPRPRTS